jgi:hypothetical protein
VGQVLIETDDAVVAAQLVLEDSSTALTFMGCPTFAVLLKVLGHHFLYFADGGPDELFHTGGTLNLHLSFAGFFVVVLGLNAKFDAALDVRALELYFIELLHNYPIAFLKDTVTSQS